MVLLMLCSNTGLSRLGAAHTFPAGTTELWRTDPPDRMQFPDATNKLGSMIVTSLRIVAAVVPGVVEAIAHHFYWNRVLKRCLAVKSEAKLGQALYQCIACTPVTGALRNFNDDPIRRGRTVRGANFKVKVTIVGLNVDPPQISGQDEDFQFFGI